MLRYWSHFWLFAYLLVLAFVFGGMVGDPKCNSDGVWDFSEVALMTLLAFGMPVLMAYFAGRESNQ